MLVLHLVSAQNTTYNIWRPCDRSVKVVLRGVYLERCCTTNVRTSLSQPESIEYLRPSLGELNAPIERHSKSTFRKHERDLPPYPLVAEIPRSGRRPFAHDLCDDKPDALKCFTIGISDERHASTPLLRSLSPRLQGGLETGNKSCIFFPGRKKLFENGVLELRTAHVPEDEKMKKRCVRVPVEPPRMMILSF